MMMMIVMMLMMVMLMMVMMMMIMMIMMIMMVQGAHAKSRTFETATNVYLDEEAPCSICEVVGDTEPGSRVMCALCRRFYHKKCDR